MSTKIKLFLTLGVVLLGALCSWLEATYADSFVAIVIIGLTVFMIIALWLFPEAGARMITDPVWFTNKFSNQCL